MKKIARITAGLILSFLFIGQIYSQNTPVSNTSKESKAQSTATVTPCKFIDTNNDGICDNLATCMKDGKCCKQSVNCCGKGNQVKQGCEKSGKGLKGNCKGSCKAKEGCCNKGVKATNPPASSDNDKK